MFAQFKRLTWKAGLLTTLVSLLGLTIALAAPGDLDTTFSGDGLVTTDFGNGSDTTIQDIAIQPDGKLIAVGYHDDPFQYDFALARYNTNGTLDTTFSGDGKLLTDFGNDEFASDVAVQPGGKIVVAGATCTGLFFSPCNLVLARYNPDGTLDNTFSGDGKQVTDFGGGDNGTEGGLAILQDGKILVAGYALVFGSYDFVLYRFNGSCPNDTQCLDTTFSGDGIRNFGFGSGRHDFATDMAIQNGKIVVVGKSFGNFAIARLNANGTMDMTFSGDGRNTTDFGGDETGYGVAQQPDGKLVVVGHKVDANDKSFSAIARYNPDGSLDDTFGQLLLTGKRSGKRVFRVLAGKYSIARDAVVLPDGKILVMGTAEGFSLVRLKPNGSAFDPTFSGDGKLIINPGGFDSAFAITRQADGKYVLGGGDDFLMARVLP